MTDATEVLRLLLDERGVEWYANDSQRVKETCWSYMGELTAAFAEYYDGTTRFDCDTWCFTPQQAIDATLGRGTCHPVISDNLTESEGTGDAWADCSECGHLLFVLTDPSSKPPRYCPSCGRRVV